MSKLNPKSYRFAETEYDKARAKFEELKNSGEYKELFFVDSHHEYSRGYWIESKKPSLSYVDFLLEEFTLSDSRDRKINNILNKDGNF